jgi:hypothetical protein
MDMTLTRTSFEDTGVYGALAGGDFKCVTLEHAYEDDQPKLLPGVYICVRGQHTLHSGPIETFEITGVPGHTGVLIHPGNAESASEGCVLVGEARVSDMITNSRVTFAAFLALHDGVDSFQLTVC